MKVLISGYYGFGNMGDEAILKSIITSLRKVDPSIEITVLSGDESHTKSTYNVDAINRYNIVKIYMELLKSDGLISGGGSLLQDVTSSRPVIYYTSIIKLAKLAKKPVFIYAQGVGPINDKKNQKIASKYINKADYITLRDQDSIDFVKSIGVNKNIDLVSDPVMGFSIDNYESQIYNEYEKRNYITVSVRDWSKATVDYLKNTAIACDEIARNGIDVVFMPMHGKEDYGISQNVIDMMKENAEIFPYETSIEEKIQCIKNSKLMIGMRLHALIFAATVNTPMIGISYDPKIDSFLDSVNQSCIGQVYKEWNPLELSNVALDIINNPNIKRKMLLEKSNILKASSEKTAKLAVELFKNKGVMKNV